MFINLRFTLFYKLAAQIKLFRGFSAALFFTSRRIRKIAKGGGVTRLKVYNNDLPKFLGTFTKA